MFEPIYSIFIHVTLLTIISQSIKLYFSFPVILPNPPIFQSQVWSCYTHLNTQCFNC
ncbi:hypothetical protein LDENG_00101170 [Lucifuga dentata]|nr:hypothetical protein LDENG_00101170 [Lucifuga dentata]